MGDLLGLILRGVGHGLMVLFDLIPGPRLRSIAASWAWPIGSRLAIGLVALLVALRGGRPWAHQLCLGASVAAFGLVCIGALCSRPEQD